ncbi:hypothetical protein QWY31_00590 [Cytophagales bacterium LB-30]|uniref:Transcriptional regulator n=1 Tax=Shiella aurantiaca TaxID=3058365 RepID=A0ABT8F0Q5_9BACT|nr:hypothetical protein [Shiella aurantiaca]MDN4163973.1 hypothetical protein [Shiella aurantiaca]
MFTENEIASFIESEDVKELVTNLRKEFILKEAPFLQISEHDFLSLIMLVPVIDLILLDKKVSFMEEMKINDKARKMSKGGFFLSHDPVVHANKFLLKKFDEWKLPFYTTLNQIISLMVDRQLLANSPAVAKKGGYVYKEALMNAPYILIRFFSAFFLTHDEDVLKEQKVSEKYLTKVKEIGSLLQFNELSAFQLFLENFQQKS